MKPKHGLKEHPRRPDAPIQMPRQEMQYSVVRPVFSMHSSQKAQITSCNGCSHRADWDCPCCRPAPALALQYPPHPRHRPSLQLGSPDRALRTGSSFNGRPLDGVKRRPSQSGASSPRRGVSASAEVIACLLVSPALSSC